MTIDGRRAAECRSRDAARRRHRQPRSPTRSRRCCTTPPSPHSGSTRPGARSRSRWRRARRPSALDAMRRADISGLSVTMPHKADVAALVDECTDVARRLDAVNCVVNRDGVAPAAPIPTARASWPRWPAGRVSTPAGQAVPGDRRRGCGPGGGAGPGRGRRRRGGGPQPDPGAGRGGGRAGRPGRVGGAGRRWRRGGGRRGRDLVVNATPVGMAGARGGDAATGSCAPAARTRARSRPTWSTPRGRRLAGRRRGSGRRRGRRPRDAGAPGGRAAGPVDRAGGPGRGHVAGRGGRRPPAGEPAGT